MRSAEQAGRQMPSWPRTGSPRHYASQRSSSLGSASSPSPPCAIYPPCPSRQPRKPCLLALTWVSSSASSSITPLLHLVPRSAAVEDRNASSSLAQSLLLRPVPYFDFDQLHCSTLDHRRPAVRRRPRSSWQADSRAYWHMGTLVEELEETLSGLVELVANPNQDPTLKVQVWTMLAAIVDTQPALGTLLLTGRHLAMTTETRLNKPDGDNQSNTKQSDSAGSTTASQGNTSSYGQALAKTALDVASEAVLSWKATYNGKSTTPRVGPPIPRRGMGPCRRARRRL